MKTYLNVFGKVRDFISKQFCDWAHKLGESLLLSWIFELLNYAWLEVLSARTYLLFLDFKNGI